MSRTVRKQKDKTMNTLKNAIEAYIKRGFGSMNKNDFEVFIFHELLKSDENCKCKSDFAISQYLKLPETKVKRLRYEANLVYGRGTTSYKEDFYNILKNRVYKSIGEDKIQFSINDKMLRLYLDDKLESFGSYADSSFNSSIVTITASDLVMLISDFEEEKEILEIVKDSISDSSKTLPQNWEEKLQNGIEAVIKDLGDKIAPNVSQFILDNIKIIGARIHQTKSKSK